MLKGSLHTVALPEVLNFLADTGKSGEFHVSGSHGEGRIWFDQGRISGFDVSRAQEASEAIFEMLRIDDGEFDFAADVPLPAEARSASAEDGPLGPALQAAEAKLAEWRDIVAVVPSLSHQLQLRAATPSGPVTLEPEQWTMVVAIGAGRSVAEVIDARGLQEFDGCKAVRDLVDASLVEVLEPVVEAAVEVVPEAVEPVEVEEPVVEAVEAVEADEAPVVEPVEEPAEVNSYAAYEVETADAGDVAEATTESHAFGAYPFGTDASLASTESGGSDHYAALRAAMVEIGENLVDEEPASTYEEPAHSVYEFQADPEMDGRAALQALLSEVTDDGVETSHHEPVDGLADRGPWTEHELSSMDSAKESWGAVDGGEASNIVPFAPIHAAEEPEEAVLTAEAGPDDAEESAPVEEPINRGLLLKFLSSVRN